MAKKVSEALARPARTALQGTPAWIITEFVDSWVYDMDDRQYGVTVLALTTLFSWIQTAVEDWRGRGILRRVPPPPAEVPVISPDPDKSQP